MISRLASMLIFALVAGALAVMPARAADPTVLTYATYAEFVQLDPATNNSTTTARAIRAAYEGLVRYKGDTSEIEPVLASSWSISRDRKMYTFKLRPGVTFHDGTPMNAQAVVFSFERLLKLNKGPAALYTDKVEGIKAADDMTVVFTLKKPWTPFLASLAVSKGPFIVSPTAVKANEKNGDFGQDYLKAQMVGTGPYKLESWDKGGALVLVKHDKYWRGWSGRHVDRVVYQYVKEYSTRRQLLLKGDADIIDAPSPEDLPNLRQDAKVRAVSSPTLNLEYIVLNMRQKALADRRVREAINLAFDRESAVKGVMSGEVIDTVGYLASGFTSAHYAVPPPKRNVERAKELIRAAVKDKGLNNDDLTLTYLYWSGEDRLRQLGEVLKASLAEAGVTVQMKELGWSAYTATILNPDQVPAMPFYGAWLTYADPSAALRPYFHSKSTLNLGGYVNPQIDAILEEAETLDDPGKRATMYKEVQKLAAADMPWIPLWGMKVTTPMRSWVKGYVFNPIYMSENNFYDVYVDR
jgi:peptide/nickel transport system substrate-binding protein